MTRTRRFAPALLLAAVAFTLAAAPASRAQDPKIPFERYTLPNGLEVILIEDHSVPLVRVDVWYHVGSGDEVPGKSGFAHLFEHMMFQGTKNTGEDKHFEVLQDDRRHRRQRLHQPQPHQLLRGRCPANQLETALWLESERMGYLPETITEKSLANQREVVRNERRQSYDNVPYGQGAVRRQRAALPRGAPLPLPHHRPPRGPRGRHARTT